MSWRINVRHRSHYRYTAPVLASFNEARITPRASNRQTVLNSSVVIDPHVSPYTYLDYWKSIVVAFDIAEPHTELVVVSDATVETTQSQSSTSIVPWSELRDESTKDKMSEFLLVTRYTMLDDELVEIANDTVRGLDPPDTVRAISEWVRQVMVYEPGTTEVSTSALEAWHQGSGVCQDFAHLTIGLLRSIGIPARYVSGYLHPDNDATPGEAARGASHAWIDAWLGSWIGTDPTNGSMIAERHVTVANGRDYRDVAPFRGVYRGGALESLAVDVDLIRVA